MEPEERKGALWECYRQLLGDGWTPDVHSYTTSFRWGAVMPPLVPPLLLRSSSLIGSGISTQVDSDARRRCSLQLQPRRQPLLTARPYHQAVTLPDAMRSDTNLTLNPDPKKTH